MGFYNILLYSLLSVLVMTSHTTTGFLLTTDNQCLANCSCTKTSIVCANKGLTTIPKFNISADASNVPEFTINLNGNNITAIPKNAFYNIRQINSTRLILDFDENKISTIDDSAFAGVEDKIVYLKLSGNNLQTLPVAIASLTNLDWLSMYWNPLSELDSYVMSRLGWSLKHFRFTMNRFTTWPKGLSKLQFLEELYINGVPFRSLPLNAFAGMESTLNDLTITGSNLTSAPVAICHLHSLTRFYLAASMLSSDDSIFEPCSVPMTNLTNMLLVNDKLQVFPNVLHAFPSLRYLNLFVNDISFIPNEAIPVSSGLTQLDLVHNHLTRIPYALNRLSSLTDLRLASNHIYTIESHDLIGLVNLDTLDLSKNMFHYIATDAFDNNTCIRTLNLGSDYLNLVPEAVRYVPNLTYFKFTSSNIECSCRLSYLKGWDVTSIRSFSGTCANRQFGELKQFLLNYLPRCH